MDNLINQIKNTEILEVASPIDLKDPQAALQWANEANVKRPWRYDFFDLYVHKIKNLEKHNIQVLEIGSGPGFLAKHLLQHCHEINYTAVDFSQAMHQLSKSKLLTNELERVEYRIADFKQVDWYKDLGQFDVVIIHQALHELRHKAYASLFHQQVKELLKDDAVYFVCDHVFAAEAMQNNQLYMSVEEHFQSLEKAAYKQVILIKDYKGLCLFECKI